MHRYAVAAVTVGLWLGAVPQAMAGVTTRVSVASDGTQGRGDSFGPCPVSADGRYVAFTSAASTLVEGDTNRIDDVFVHDRQTGRTTRVSLASDGAQGTNSSGLPSISADGRYVAFSSWASNLVEGDTNSRGDVFVHDRQTGKTTRVSVATDGTQANDTSGSPSISADGRYVAFHSTARNLVADDTNGVQDVFLHDCGTGRTTRVSVSSGGVQGDKLSERPAVSGDGRYIAFDSDATNLVAAPTHGGADIFIYDRRSGQTALASVGKAGGQANNHSYYPSISADGRYVAFQSYASNLVDGDTNAKEDVFVYDRRTAKTTRVSVAGDGTQSNDGAACASISADGRFVAFDALAGNLVANDTNGRWDDFVHDCWTGQTVRVSVASDGTQGNGDSWAVSISATGGHVALQSRARNLVPGDTNGRWDVFAHDLTLRQPDTLVRNPGDSSFRGNNVYNTTGVGQTKVQTVAAGSRAVYQVTVENDGTADDTFTVRGGAGDALWRVRYFDLASGATEITSEVTGGGWTTPSLAPGAKRGLRLEVRPKRGTAAGASKTVLVKATSAGDATKKDAVKAVTTVAGGSSLAAISQVAALLAGAGALVVFSLSAPADVDGRILNIAGRPVKTLCQARDCEAGTNTLLWNAQGDNGLAVPNGTYLVEILAASADGSRARAMARVVLRR